MPSYDLLSEPWIPVIAHGDNVVRRVSLVELLHDAPDISRLASRSPAIRAALFLHLVLGAYWDLAGVPRNAEEWRQRWERGRIDGGAVGAWATEVEPRFDLFHPDAPFAQVAGLEATNGEVKSAASLDPFRELGGSTPMFWVPAEVGRQGYSPAEAAELLIHTLAFDTAGIKTGAVGDPHVKGGKLYGNPVGPRGQVGTLIPIGTNLFETVLLNTPITPDGRTHDDVPHWRRAPLTAAWTLREPAGPLDWITYPSRRVSLIPTQHDDGSVTVDSVIVTGGDRFTSPDPRFELHSAWKPVDKPKPDDPPRRAMRHRSGRHAWQGMTAMVALAALDEQIAATEPPKLLAQIGGLQADDILESTYPLRIQAVGYEYGTQSAVFENLIFDELPLPVAALRGDAAAAEFIDDLARSADELVRALDGLDGDLRRASGGDPTPWDKGQRPGTRLVQQLDPVVRRLLAGLQREPERNDDARTAWRELASQATRDLGQSLLSALPPTAFAGREVAVGGRDRIYRASTAELTFRWRVRQALTSFVVDTGIDSEHAEEVGA